MVTIDVYKDGTEYPEESTNQLRDWFIYHGYPVPKWVTEDDEEEE